MPLQVNPHPRPLPRDARGRGELERIGSLSPTDLVGERCGEGVVPPCRRRRCSSPAPLELVEAPMADVARIADLVGLDLVQLHGDETPDQVAHVQRPVIVARRVSGAVPWDELASYEAWAYLLDSHVPGKLGGTGQAWDYSLASERRPPEARLILAGGLGPHNVADAVRAVRPWGVDVASGVEGSPGRKDVQKMRAFVREAKGA
ncbi:MAG: phosphoribosylanthranilate isomerase [Anaerolineae bacterium]